MASHSQASDTKKQAPQPKTPQPEAPQREQFGQQASAAAIIQRAFSAPPNSGDILTLQKVVGNRAVTQLMVQRSTNAPSIQRMNQGGEKDSKSNLKEFKSGVAANLNLADVEEPQRSEVAAKVSNGGKTVEFILLDGIEISTDEGDEFVHVIDILWKTGRDVELKFIATTLLTEIKGKPLVGLALQGSVDIVMGALTRNKKTYAARKSIDEFLNYVAKTFSWNPELLTEKFFVSKPEWGAATANGLAIRKKIIQTAVESRALLNAKQLALWEENAGDFTEDDLGLVDERMNDYLAAVKEYAQSQRNKQVNAKKQITALYQIAGSVLLKELWVSGLFPPLEIVDFGEDDEFSRANWVMRIGRRPAPLEVLQEISASILHETRHVEQAWAISTLWWHKRAEALKGIDSKSVEAIHSKCRYPSQKGKQVKETAQRGESYHVKWDEIGKLQHALGATMHETAQIDSINWKQLSEFFVRIYWYFNHPREYDAYASEQVYQVAFKRSQ